MSFITIYPFFTGDNNSTWYIGLLLGEIIDGKCLEQYLAMASNQYMLIYFSIRMFKCLYHLEVSCPEILLEIDYAYSNQNLFLKKKKQNPKQLTL